MQDDTITLKKLIDRTMTLDRRFPKQYSKEEGFMDLVEEVGELAQAMLISSGAKFTNDPTKQRSIEDVEDALCDVLFQVIRLAELHGIDLTISYPKVLNHIEERFTKGEFDVES